MESQDSNNTRLLEEMAAKEEIRVKNEFKKEHFDREFRLLVKQSQETIDARYKCSIEVGQVRTELIFLNKYMAIYEKMSPQEHYSYFETIYNRNRVNILKCREDDSWIRKGKIIIQFGDGIKGMAEKCRQIKIMLSDIFLIACDLQEKAEKSLDDYGEQFSKEIGGKDLIRPNIILLHLMRIFYHLNDGMDKERLGEIVTEFENELGVSKKTAGSEPWLKSSESQQTKSTPTEGGGGGISALFNVATDMMEKMGFKPPPGIKAPNDQEIATVIKNVFQNDKTQSAMQGIFQSLQGCNDIGEAVQKVVSNVASPDTIQAIHGTIVETTQSAQSSQPPITNLLDISDQKVQSPIVNVPETLDQNLQPQ